MEQGPRVSKTKREARSFHTSAWPAVVEDEARVFFYPISFISKLISNHFKT
jgi:hypothetical protein